MTSTKSSTMTSTMTSTTNCEIKGMPIRSNLIGTVKNASWPRFGRWVVGTVAFGAMAIAAPAWAGRGATPAEIQSAIASNSPDAIAAELEQAENLVCGVCTSMVRPLIDHPDARVREVAGWWLSRRGRSELFVDMSLRLAQPDSTLARNAADVLGAMRLAKGVTPLAAALGNPVFNADAHAAMARALGAIADPSGLPALQAALSDGDPQVRQAAAQGLRGVNGFSDPAALLPLLQDADASVRGEAIYSIGSTRSLALKSTSAAAIVSALVGLVGNDPSPDVRKKAAWALGEIGASSAVAGPALQQAAQKDADPLVRSLANAALGRLRS